MNFVHRLAPVLALVLVTGFMSACATAPVDEDALFYLQSRGLTDRQSLRLLVSGFFRSIIAGAASESIEEEIAEAVSAKLDNLEVTPAPARTGVGNFFDNLAYPVVALNAFLQGKFEQGFEDLGRFIFNSTFGLGGLIDFSSGVGLERHEEDFGQTLAVWGFGPGFYTELPTVGPKTASEAAVIPADVVTDVLFYASSSVAIPLGLLRMVRTRHLRFPKRSLSAASRLSDLRRGSPARRSVRYAAPLRVAARLRRAFSRARTLPSSTVPHETSALSA